MKRRVVPMLILVAVLTVACGQPAGPRRVLLIGMDAADWSVIDPLIAEGRLPNFAKLRQKGATGPLQSEEPLISPAIWTTIATGMSRERHGITDFVTEVGGETALMTSNMRRVKAIWNIAGEAGKRVGVVNWWGSYPAEAVNGYVVTNYLPYFYAQALAERVTVAQLLNRVPQVTWPADLAPQLAGFATGDLLADTGVDLSGVRQFPGNVLFDEALTVLFRNSGPVYQLVLAHDQFVRRASLHLFRQMPTDLQAVYYDSADVACHAYWSFFTSQKSSPRDEALRGVVPATYEFLDRMLGDHLAALERDRVLVVVSDHGYGPLTPSRKHFHQPNGIAAIYGPGVRPGAKIGGMRITDVTPTVLRILGLPTANDMDGRANVSMFADEYQRAFGTAAVATYKTGAPRGDRQPVVTQIDEAVREQLKTLGYIQ
jgi:hypothetical protein